MIHHRLLLNIGNTHVQLAEEIKGQPQLIQRLDTADVIANPHRLTDLIGTERRVVASSVVPELKQALKQTLQGQIQFLTPLNFPQMDFSCVDTSTMGMDRICNAAAILNHNGKGPVAVFDCGTCLASVAIDGHNTFRGGTIAPGRQLLRHALHDHTAQLPLLPIRQDCPDILGTNTHDAIRAGVDLGALGTLNFLAEKTRQALGEKDCTIYLTGGDADFFLKALPNLKPAPDFLTLRGIAAAVLNNGESIS